MFSKNLEKGNAKLLTITQQHCPAGPHFLSASGIPASSCECRCSWSPASLFHRERGVTGVLLINRKYNTDRPFRRTAALVSWQSTRTNPHEETEPNEKGRRTRTTSSTCLSLRAARRLSRCKRSPTGAHS